MTDKADSLDELLDLARRQLDVAIDSNWENDNTTALEELHGLSAVREDVTSAAIRMLQDPDWRQRLLGARIVREIQSRREETARAALQALRAEEHEDAAHFLVAVFGLNSLFEALPDLIAFTEHPDPALRRTAAGAVASCAGDPPVPEAIDTLCRLLEDPDAEVRFSAAYDLAEWWIEDGIRNSRIAAALAKRLYDEDSDVRKQVRRALKRYSGPGVDPSS